MIEITDDMLDDMVSDHAVVRYLERVVEVDMRGYRQDEYHDAWTIRALVAAKVIPSARAVRKVILTPRVVAAIRMKAKSIETDGYLLCLGDERVVTVVSLDQRSNRMKKYNARARHERRHLERAEQ